MRRRRTPLVLQAESAECGLASLLMVGGHHGHHIGLAAARDRWAISMRGATLADLVRIAGQIGLAARALRLEPGQLAMLRLPCVLHWDLDHFVVLDGLDDGGARLLDPALGERRVSTDELARHFSGVALELTPAPGFAPMTLQRPLRLAPLLGDRRGLIFALAHGAGLALLLQLFALAAPLQVQWVVDHALAAGDTPLVLGLGAGFALLVLLQVATAALRAWVLAVVGARLRLQMAQRLFAHLLRLPMAWFEKRWVGDVASRFDSLEQMQATLTTSAVEALIDGVMALATLALMAAYSPRLALLAATAVVAYAALRLAWHRRQRDAAEQHLVQRGRQQSHWLESVRGMQCIKLAAAEREREQGFGRRLAQQAEAALRVQRLALTAQAVQGLLVGLEAVAAITLAALLVIAGELTLGMLFGFMAYKLQFVSRTMALVDRLLELRMLGLHAERVADVTGSATEHDGSGGDAAAAPLAAIGTLRCEGVSFRYGSGDAEVLSGIDLAIAPGESVVIVGPSGCGKSTLVKLLLGLLEPTGGQVTCDGRPLRAIGLARWRGAVASVMQDEPLFAGSIASNIALFDPQPDAARIEACARAAAVHEDIEAMAMGYATLVGETGAVVSGGQKQRIVLARALYRRPRLLVLDEATSHLDAEAERRVNEAIAGLGITRVMVAHRAETIAAAGRVVRLAGGQVADDAGRQPAARPEPAFPA